MRLALIIATLSTSFICHDLSADEPTTQINSSEERLAAVETALQTLLKEVSALREEMTKGKEANNTPTSQGNEFKLVEEAKDELLMELKAKKDAYDKFRRDAPLMWADGVGTNLHHERMAQIESKRAELQLAMDGKRADKQAIQEFQKSDKQSKALERFAVWILRNPDKVVAFEGLINKSDDITPILGVFAEIRGSEIQMAEAQIAELDRLYVEEQKQANKLQQFVAEEARHRTGIKRTQQLLDAVVNRLNEVNH